MLASSDQLNAMRNVVYASRHSLIMLVVYIVPDI